MIQFIKRILGIAETDLHEEQADKARLVFANLSKLVGAS